MEYFALYNIDVIHIPKKLDIGKKKGISCTNTKTKKQNVKIRKQLVTKLPYNNYISKTKLRLFEHSFKLIKTLLIFLDFLSHLLLLI